MILYSKELLLNNKGLPSGTVLYSSTTPGQETDVTIPAGVKSIYFELVGGAGLSYTSSGGAGGKVTGYMKVSKGLVLHLVTAYAWNNNYTPVYNASDLRLPSLSTNWWEQRIATAGGGGCASTQGVTDRPGGIGGYNATAGSASGIAQTVFGQPGTQTANGAAGVSTYNGNPGGSYAVGHGGAGITSGNYVSGAGGAGWYPGGSGAGRKPRVGDKSAYGGGGGASNINPNYIYDVQYFDGVNTGTGSVLVTVNS